MKRRRRQQGVRSVGKFRGARRQGTVRLAGTLALAGLVLSGCTALGLEQGPRPGGSEAELPQMLDMAERGADTGNLAMAANVYHQAAARFPESADPHLGLGRVAYARGDSEEAATHYRAALQRAPDSFEARYGLGKAMLAGDRLAAAIREFDALIDSGVEDHRPFLARGVALDLQGRHGAAQDSYRAGLEIAPMNVALRNNLGLSLALAEDHDGAAGILEDLARDPTAPARTRQNLALVYGLSGRMDNAAATAQQDLSPREVDRNLAFYEALNRARRNGAPEAAAESPGGQVSGIGDSGDAASGDGGDAAPLQLAARFDAVGDAGVSQADPERTVRPPRALPVPDDPETPTETPATDRESGTGPPETAVGSEAPAETTLDSGEVDGQYWIQFASFAEEATGERAWERLRERHTDLLDGHSLSLQPAEIEGRGTFYRVRIGPFADSGASRGLCDAMQDRGQDCLVIRP